VHLNHTLFSVSTLNDALPATGPTPVQPDSIRMHEDDWRQFEFVDSRLDGEVAAELAEVDRIWTEQSVDMGRGMTAFRKVHVRNRILRPLEVPMSPAQFAQLFGAPATTATTTVALRDSDRTFRNVVAVRLGDDLFVYAAFENDHLVTLGVETEGPFALKGEAADRFAKFIVDHHLQLVHWPSRRRLAVPENVAKYLRGDGDGEAQHQ
jgi:hypothetical protein